MSHEANTQIIENINECLEDAVKGNNCHDLKHILIIIFETPAGEIFLDSIEKGYASKLLDIYLLLKGIK